MNEPAHVSPAADTSELVRKGLLALTLVVLGASVLLAYVAINDIIVTWLEDRWVPVWRAAFALGVAGMALWVLARLTGRRLA